MFQSTIIETDELSQIYIIEIVEKQCLTNICRKTLMNKSPEIAAFYFEAITQNKIIFESRKK